VNERFTEVGIAQELDGAVVMRDDHHTAWKFSKASVPHSPLAFLLY
jgi:hypothetical protein